jgi:hypothetical protein
MPADRGVKVDHTAIFRCIQSQAAVQEKRLRLHLRPCNGALGWKKPEVL